MTDEIRDQEMSVAKTIVCINEIEGYNCNKCHFKTQLLTSLKQHLTDGCQHKTPDEVAYRCLKCCFSTYSKYHIVRHGFFCKILTVDEMDNTVIGSEGHPLQNNNFLGSRNQENGVALVDFLVRRTKLPQSRHLQSKSRFDFLKNSTRQGASKFKRKPSLMKRVTVLLITSDYVQWFQCEHCPFASVNKSVMTRHVNTACHIDLADVIWLECALCPRKLKSKFNLKAHMKSYHSDPEKIIQWFTCELCSTKFTSEINLDRHMNHIHSKPEYIEWFQCKLCPSKFQLEMNLHKHVKFLHPEPVKVEWLQCQLCPSKYKTKTNFYKHRESHHVSGDYVEWLKCELCSSKFKRKSNLTTHIKLLHSKPENIRWFSCEFCPSRFKRKWELNKHNTCCYARDEDPTVSM